MTGAAAAVDATGLEKRFGGVVALTGVDLRVECGRVHGLLGPNGAGKTTLLRALLGLVRPDQGSISLFGRPVTQGAAALDGVAGFVEEPRFHPYLTARRNLELLAELDGRSAGADRIESILERVGLSPSADRRAGTFSTGMRQRLGIAASLLREPRLLVLDEPTAGLDPNGLRDVRALVKNVAGSGTTVLLSSHDIAELEGLCERLTILRRGRVAWDGATDELAAQAPAPAYRLRTSDDRRALELAARRPDVQVQADADEGLSVVAEDAALDAYVVKLGRDGVAVRRLELVASPLESVFFSLTSEDAHGAAAR